MRAGAASAADRRPDFRARVGAPRRVVARRPGVIHSRFVGALKLLLPLVAALLLALVAAWPHIQASVDRLRFMLPRIDLREAHDLRMVNARYSGIDNSNRPYVVTADVARQTPNKDDTLSLEGPAADITLQSGTWLALTSDTGLYQSQAQRLDLYGQVNLYHDRGMTFATDSAHIDLGKGTAEGKEPVAGHGPAGEIESEGFFTLDRGDVVVFTGKARLLLNAASRSGSAE